MRESIQRIVSAAARAPNPENAQPFTFQWDGRSLRVRHEPERARHRLDIQKHLSLLTLGLMLESLALAASTEGLQMEETLHLDDLASPVWATVRFSEGATTDALAGVLGVRRTDRRLYLRGSLQAPVFEELHREVERFADNGLHLSPRPEGEWLAFCLEAESLLWRDPVVYRDVMRWVRFSEKELQRTRDGSPWRSIGPPLPSFPGVQLVRNELVRNMLARTHLYRASAQWLRAQLASSAGLLCITVRSHRRQSLVAAGRLGLSCWLRLNRAGYAVQPMSLQSTPIYALALQCLPSDLPHGLHELFARGRELMNRAFGLAREELSVWMFRTGRAIQSPAGPETPRLPEERVLKFADGQIRHGEGC